MFRLLMGLKSKNTMVGKADVVLVFVPLIDLIEMEAEAIGVLVNPLTITPLISHCELALNIENNRNIKFN